MDDDDDAVEANRRAVNAASFWVLVKVSTDVGSAYEHKFQVETKLTRDDFEVALRSVFPDRTVEREPRNQKMFNVGMDDRFGWIPYEEVKKRLFGIPESNPVVYRYV